MIFTRLLHVRTRDRAAPLRWCVTSRIFTPAESSKAHRARQVRVHRIDLRPIVLTRQLIRPIAIGGTFYVISIRPTSTRIPMEYRIDGRVALFREFRIIRGRRE